MVNITFTYLHSRLQFSCDKYYKKRQIYLLDGSHSNDINNLLDQVIKNVL